MNTQEIVNLIIIKNYIYGRLNDMSIDQETLFEIRIVMKKLDNKIISMITDDEFKKIL